MTNSIAFANLKDPQKAFGPVRMWGSIGWIGASVAFIFILVNWAKVPSLAEAGPVNWLGKALSSGLNPKDLDERRAYLNGVSFTYVAAGIASLVLAAFSLTLPHTPPKPAATSEQRFAWLEAIKLLNKP